MKTKLRDLLSPQPKSKIKAGEGKQEGKYKFFTSSPVQNKHIDVANYTKPALIFGTGGNASVHFCNEPFSTSTDCLVMFGRNEQELQTIYFFLRNNMYLLEGGFKGAGLKHISKEYILDLSIELPSSTVQQELLQKASSIESMVAKRKEQLAKLDTLVKSRFIEMFGDTKNKIPLGEICNVTGGYSFKSGDISNDGAIKILQIGNVYLDNVTWDTINYLPRGYDEKYSKFLLNEGDIVVALTRPIIQSLGNVKACIVKSSDLPCLLNQRVGRIVPKGEKSVFVEFIYGCLMTDEFTRYVESCSIGCSQPNISTKDIENYLIPNATYEEQKSYVAIKRQTDKSKLAIQQSLERLETLKKSLMQKYFG